MNDFKLRYQKLWQTVQREGVQEFLDWLDTTDFYTAPCSTKYHLARKSGLVEHSLDVHEGLDILCDVLPNGSSISPESRVICSLGHDICKADFYAVESKNVRENGVWVSKPFYVIKDKFPYGHGEKSALLLNRFIKLKTGEFMAIRWHMGGFTQGIQDYGLSSTMSEAFRRYPLAVLLHMADMNATYLMEARGE